MTKRSSTTKRISRMDVQALSWALLDGGFIIRHRGQEYGCVDLRGTGGHLVAMTWEGVALPLKECTIPKLTIRTLRNEQTPQLALVA